MGTEGGNTGRASFLWHDRVSYHLWLHSLPATARAASNWRTTSVLLPPTAGPGNSPSLTRLSSPNISLPFLPFLPRLASRRRNYRQPRVELLCSQCSVAVSSAVVSQLATLSWAAGSNYISYLISTERDNRKHYPSVLSEISFIRRLYIFHFKSCTLNVKRSFLFFQKQKHPVSERQKRPESIWNGFQNKTLFLFEYYKKIKKSF